MPSCPIKAKGRHLGSRGSSSSRRLHWNAACTEQVPPFGKASVSKGQESFMNISLGGLLLLCREHLAGLSRGHRGFVQEAGTGKYGTGRENGVRVSSARLPRSPQARPQKPDRSSEAGFPEPRLPGSKGTHAGRDESSHNQGAEGETGSFLLQVHPDLTFQTFHTFPGFAILSPPNNADFLNFRVTDQHTRLEKRRVC